MTNYLLVEVTSKLERVFTKIHPAVKNNWKSRNANRPTCFEIKLEIL